MMAALLFCCIVEVQAQAQQQKEIASSTNGWFLLMNEFRFSPKWFLSTEVHLRRADHVVNEWQQILLRPAINYRITPAIDFGVGYTYIRSFPYGEQPLRTIVPENQLWQQLHMRHSIGKVGLMHRYRLEERWIGSIQPDDEGGFMIEGSDYAQRFRYRLFARVPLYNIEEGQKQLFISAWDELFINLERDFMFSNFQQNRIYIGLGYQFSPMVNLQAGYMSQVVRKLNGFQYERNPTINVSLFYNIDLYKK
ncbi:hypothetical protein D770_01360 [Flammeovirgaceae bacterium 311]|nr:hypothetical protein D770_01360 [Flammeovirgaceae bacterium 311]